MAVSLSSGAYLLADEAVVVSAPITLACWFKPSIAQSAALISVSKSSSASDYLELGVVSTGESYAVARTGAWQGALSTSTYTPGAWQHVAGVFPSASNRTISVSGVAEASNAAFAQPTALNRTAIGTLVRSTSSPVFEGELAEVAIWQTALEQVEIAALAEGVSPLSLANRMNDLALYRDFIRVPGLRDYGPVLTAVGTVGVSEHPSIVYPSSATVLSASAFTRAGVESMSTYSSGAESAQVVASHVEASLSYPFAEVIG